MMHLHRQSIFFSLMQRAFIPLLVLIAAQQAWSQCNNGSPFGTVTAPTNNTPVTITTCAFAGEYSTINSCVAGSTYQFSATGGAGNYLTVRQGTPGGTVLGFGFSPITVLCTASGPLYLHYNTDAACGTDGSCHTGVVQCTSCSGGGATCPAGLGTTVNIPSLPYNGFGLTTCGAGNEITSANATICGSSSYYGGEDLVFIFTPTTSGPITISLTSASSWIGMMLYNGCPFIGQGGACVGSIQSSAGSKILNATVTAGVTYYLVVDTWPSPTCIPSFDLSITAAAGFDPCASIPTIACATPTTATRTGAGVWSPGTCGFSTPGQEQLYSFTPTTTGVHQLQVTSTSATTYIDYFYKVASGGCNATGWTCILDIFSPTTVSMGTLTAGTTYYILLDPESTVSVTHTFQILCPSGVGAPPCVASPTSPTNGQTNICPTATQTLSWPASPGATSYDVYFGTTNPPPFVGNTSATSFVASTPGAGTRYWQIRPVGPGGTASGCNVWSFTKQDITPPTITCPANVSGNNNPATACSAVMTYGSISASDACGAPSIVLQSGLPSGSVFPVGVNTVVYRATDGVGLTATCSFTVTVNDVTLPTITCPANITGNNDPGVCGAVRTYNTPPASDNCGIQSVTLISGLPSGSTFPVGITTNTWRATDVNNNTRTCAFTVSINDVEAPELTCPPDLVRPNDAGQCSRVISNLGQAGIDDNCIPASLTNNSPGTFPVGMTQVTYVLADNSGNTVTCVQSVTVYDQEYPGIICPPTIVALTDEGDCVATVDFSVVTVVDNCPGYTVEYSADPLSTFDIGYSSVTATVTDASGNASNCTFLIHVKTRPEVCNDFDDDCDGLTDEAENWTKVAKRIAKGGGAFDEYGIAIDVDGDWAVVGSNKKNAAGQSVGTAYILRRSLTTPEKWVGITSVLPDQVFPGDGFGLSVAVDSNVIAVGAPFDDESAPDAGAVYLYQQSESNPNAWVLLKKVLASGGEAGENLGSSLSLDGGWLAAGAPMRDGAGTDRGAVHLFERDLGGPNEWGHSAQVDAPDGEDNDWMGASVSLDAGRLLAGAPGDDDKGPEAGAAYVFQGTTLVKKISGNQVQAGDQFGRAVALSGAHAVVGAPYNDLHGDDAGAAFSFYQHAGGPNNWGQWALFSNNFSQDGDHFGAGVALDGEYAVITAPNDDPFGSNSGMGHVYLRVSQGWAPLTTISSGGGDLPNEAANFGHSVAMDGRTIVVGAWHDQTGVDANRGSAYFFEGVCAEEAGQRDQNDEFTASIPGLDVQCRPVPFDDVLTIEVTTSAPEIRVTILNTLGQEVTVLNQSAVPGRFDWQAGKAQPGLYFVRVQAGDLVQTKSVVLARP